MNKKNYVTMKNKNYVTMLPTYGDPNSLAAWDITLWGMEVLRLLQERQLASQFVNRDYGTAVERFGKTIEARTAANMNWKRRNLGNPIKKQALNGDTVPLTLDQMWHTAFVVDDWGASRSFGNIIETYLLPAAEALGRGVNASLLAQSVQFLDRRAGTLNGLTNSNAISYLTGFNGAMNEGQDWGGVPLFIDNETRTTLLNVETFHRVDSSGDNEVLKKARLGEKFNMDLFKTSDVPGNRNRQPTHSTTVNGAEPAGDTVVTLTSGTGFTAGKRISLNGRPYKIASVSTNVVTLTSPLLENLDTGTAALAYPTTAIDLAAGYVKGHAEAITLDDAVTKGDILDIGDATYAVAQVDIEGVWLDRPLAAAVADGAAVAIWPAGAYNFGFSRNAILMAARALPAAPADTGVRSTVTAYNDLPIRINLQYDADMEQMLVNLSILGGLVPVMKNEGGVMLT